MLSYQEHQLIDEINNFYEMTTGINIVQLLEKENRNTEENDKIIQYKNYVGSLIEETEKLRDFAILSDQSYINKDSTIGNSSDFKQLSFTDIVQKDKRVFPLFDLVNNLNNTKNNDGFHAEVFYNEKNEEYAVAFRGTEQIDPHNQARNKISDIIVDIAKGEKKVLGSLTTDFIQGTGNSSTQYKMAKEVGEMIKQLSQESGLKISITGHSLGGGLATVAGLVSGNQTYVYNPAGVHPNTIKEFNLEEQSSNCINITRVSTHDDFLTNMQEKRGATANLLLPPVRMGDAIIRTVKGDVKGIKQASQDLPSAIGIKTTIRTGGGHSIVPIAYYYINQQNALKNIYKHIKNN